jgi:hypothetical protein
LYQNTLNISSGVGLQEGAYNVKLKENASPVAHPPRLISVRFKEQGKEQLDMWEVAGIIRK